MSPKEYGKEVKSSRGKPRVGNLAESVNVTIPPPIKAMLLLKKIFLLEAAKKD